MTPVGQSKHGIDEKIAEQNKPNIINMKIGGVTYIVSSHFSKTAKLNVVDTVSRLIENDAETA